MFEIIFDAEGAVAVIGWHVWHRVIGRPVKHRRTARPIFWTE